MPKLSLCLITRNEEDDLPRCLESVRQIADEIVVVDTGSTDNTVGIAHSFDAKVIEMPWQDDFSIPRNRAIEEASGDWVLMLDADETLDGASRQHIREAVGSDVDALNVVIRNHLFDDSLFESHSNRFVRLFRHRPEFRFEGRVHEQILPSIHRSGGKVQERNDIVIEHFGFAEKNAENDERQKRNLRLLDMESTESPEDGSVRFHMGVTLQAIGKAQEALHAFESALEFGRVNGTLPLDLKSQAHTRLAQLYLAQNALETAMIHCEDAAESGTTDPLTYSLTATIHMHKSRFGPAAEALENGLNVAEAHDDNSLEAGIRRHELRLALAHCRHLEGRIDEAVSAYEACTRENPGCLDAWLALGECEYQRNQLQNAKIAFARALKLDPESETAQMGWQQCRIRKYG